MGQVLEDVQQQVVGLFLQVGVRGAAAARQGHCALLFGIEVVVHWGEAVCHACEKN
jgi:hypothetical protein